jgi:vitamin B12 transporter
MKRTTLALLSIIGCAMAHPIQAQTPTTDSIRLDEVWVHENRLQIPFSKQNRNVYVIDQAVLSKLPAQTLPELLRYISGVDLRQRGPFGTQADISIDGGSFEQTLILVNGVKILDAQTAHNALNLPIPADAIERIEVLRGPAARIYGINSLTGAINIITKKPAQSGIAAHVYSGSSFQKDTSSNELFIGKGVQLSGNIRSDNQQHMLAGSHESSNGYRYNTAFRNQKLYYQGDISLNAANSLHLHAGYVDNDFGANGFYAAPGDKESQEIIKTVLAGIGYRAQLSPTFSLRPRVSYRYNEDDYRYFRHDLNRARSQHYTHSVGGEINSLWQSAVGNFGFGIEARQEQIRSTNIGDHNRDNYGAYAEFQPHLGEKIQLNGGVYANYNSDFGWQVFPGIDIGYLITNQWKIVAAAGSSQRIPSFTDLHLNQRPGNIGNPDLLSERAWQIEGGTKFQTERWNLQGTYFYRNIVDFIDWVRLTNDIPWQPQNVDGNRTHGLSGQIQWLASGSTAERTSHYIQFAHTSLWPTLEVATNPGQLSKYALESLRHQTVAQWIIQCGPWGATLAGRYQERINYKDYVLIDGRLQYQWQQLRVYADLQNVLDVTYVEAGAVPLPGRWATLGLKYSLAL